MTDCQHSREHVDAYTQRAGLNRWTYYRCMGCGVEWTEAATASDLSDAVTSDEVLEAHQRLEAEVAWRELIRCVRAHAQMTFARKVWSFPPINPSSGRDLTPTNEPRPRSALDVVMGRLDGDR